MKYLITLLIAALSLNAFGQTEGWEYPFPYNPDGNADGYIGLNDLLDLLAIYGQEFGPDQLYSSDSDAIIDFGVMYFGECIVQCSQLQGNWKVSDIEGIGKYRDDLEDSDYWVESIQNGGVGGSSTYRLPVINAGTLRTALVNEDNDYRRCACLTRAYPMVEYTYCTGSSSFDDCVNERLLEGWHLLGGISRDSGNSSRLQALWKYAE